MFRICLGDAFFFSLKTTDHPSITNIKKKKLVSTTVAIFSLGMASRTSDPPSTSTTATATNADLKLAFVNVFGFVVFTKAAADTFCAEKDDHRDRYNQRIQLTPTEYTLRTGDLIGARGDGVVSKTIEIVDRPLKETDISISHVGVIVVNPSWVKEQGTYVLHSSAEPFASAEHANTWGVRTDTLADFLSQYPEGHVWVQTLEGPSLDEASLNEFHKTMHAKPYDKKPCDFIHAILCKHRGNAYEFLSSNPGTSKKVIDCSSTFWCSALVAALYCELNVFKALGYHARYVTPAELFDDDWVNEWFQGNYNFRPPMQVLTKSPLSALKDVGEC
jgi:hypothetical protein